MSVWQLGYRTHTRKPDVPALYDMYTSQNQRNNLQSYGWPNWLSSQPINIAFGICGEVKLNKWEMYSWYENTYFTYRWILVNWRPVSAKGVDYYVLRPYDPLTNNVDPVLSKLDCPLLQREDKLINVSLSWPRAHSQSYTRVLHSAKVFTQHPIGS